jgi:predicted MFS family arabinose efflux permease
LNKYAENNVLRSNRGYSFLIGSQTVSNLGDWLDFLALISLLGLQWRVTPLEMMISMMCITVPSIVLGPFLGVLADRVTRKGIMIVSDILRAFLVLGIVFSTELWCVNVLLIFKSALSAFFFAAKNGKLKELVSDENMAQAITISSMIDNSTKIAGPFISGTILASVGIKPAFYIDALTFVISACLLLWVPGAPIQQKAVSTRGDFFSQFKEGLMFIKASKLLLLGSFITSWVLLVMQVVDSQLVIFLRDIPNIPGQLIGNCMAASGIGMLIMAWYLNRTLIERNFLIQFVKGILFLAVAILVLLNLRESSLEVWWVYMVPFFFAGSAMSLVLIPFQVFMQKGTPSVLIGRVTTTYNSITNFASTIGILFGGVFVSRLGTDMVFSLAGYSLLLFGLLLCVFIQLEKRQEDDYNEVQIQKENRPGL